MISSELPAPVPVPSPPELVEDTEGTRDTRALEGAASTVP